ncbi:MAG: acyl-ACP--UDP-N-acetylglucosamine O-acyltransferase [Candidatus Omnitrophica bacterium]|nr:acyl-ACP--UDP-N-acetylglucosamine O-acyltransferase [Candidatus Omnitrophota bacterium]
MKNIHPSSQIASDAVIHPQAVIGPFVAIGPGVTIGEGTVLEAHTVVERWTTIGCHNRIGPSAVLGGAPQHRDYHGQKSFLKIGDHNRISEFTSLHRASREGETTVIGSHNFLMNGVHLGHDGVIGDHVVLTGGVLIGGHVTLEDHAVVGGMAGVHQFVRIGRHAMVGGLSRVTRDVLPFALAEGNPAAVRGVNLVGLRRAGFSNARIASIRKAYRDIYFSGRLFEEVFAELEREARGNPDVAEMVRLIRDSKRGFLRKSSSGKRDD